MISHSDVFAGLTDVSNTHTVNISDNRPHLSLVPSAVMCTVCTHTLCVCVCVRACVRACVCVNVCCISVVWHILGGFVRRVKSGKELFFALVVNFASQLLCSLFNKYI